MGYCRRLREAGCTVLGLVIVVTVGGLLAATPVPRTTLVVDPLSVRTAAGDVRATVPSARSIALAGYAGVAVPVNSERGTLPVRRGPETILSRGIGHAHGVRITSTRDS